MLETLQNQLQLPGSTLLLATAVVMLSGMVRGFSGFGLSALIMSVMAVIIPPIALIPVCFTLEAVASLVMFRGGVTDGNLPLVLKLVAGHVLGLPLGLAVTYSLTPDASRLVALILILSLSMIQLLKVSPAFLRMPWSVYAAGLLAGVATGLASSGGMVIALYVLALHIPARRVRGSLVLFLFCNMAVTAFWMITTGTLDTLALTRALFLAPAVIMGVLIGSWLFRPALEQFYKRFCLLLLISLAALGLARLVFI